MAIRTTRLDNGVRIITEVVDSVYSASIGAWIDVGSEDESEKSNGASHCLEHMLFKGTETRSAVEIAQQIEDVGGSLGASTGKENTCFYGHVIGENLPVAVELIVDMLNNAVISQKDLDLERQVILEEIKMYEDDPEDFAHETLALNIWPGHPLSRPITGTQESVAGIDEADLKKHVKDYYTPDKMIFSIAGNFDEAGALAQLRSLLETRKPGAAKPELVPPQMVPFKLVKHKDIEQAHLLLVTHGLKVVEPRRFSLAVLDLCLGGNMSSRLFQEVREKRGLVYSINTFRESHRQTGLTGIYAGASPKHIPKVLELISAELKKVKKEAFSQPEIDRAKTQLKSELLLGLESMRNRGARNAYCEMYYGRQQSVDEICGEIEEVTRESVQNLANEIFQPEFFSLVVVGPASGLQKDYEVTC